MTTITGKTVLLTGASGGIGIYIARALAQEKATVIGVSRNQEKLDRVGDEIQTLGGKWIGISFDISKIEELPGLVEKIGSIDILINNAAVEIYRAFQDYSADDVRSVLFTNLLSAIELSRLLLPKMLETGSGHIVNVASLAAKKGHPYDSIYSASKAGLLMWSDAIRQELAGTNVNISVICPGYISQQGMLANTGIPAPSLSGTSTPKNVANAVIQTIKNNQAEVIINQNLITEILTKLLLATWQLFPLWGDTIYQSIGVKELNKKRIKSRTYLKSFASNS